PVTLPNILIVVAHIRGLDACRKTKCVSSTIGNSGGAARHIELSRCGAADHAIISFEMLLSEHESCLTLTAGGHVYRARCRSPGRKLLKTFEGALDVAQCGGNLE